MESQKSRPEAVLGDKRPVQSRLGRQEARPEAVLTTRRPVRRPSWTPGGPSRGRLGRQEACPKAVLTAMRPVQRPSWTPEGPSKGRLDARGLVCRPSWPSGGQNAGFTAVLLQNAGFAQAAGGATDRESSRAAKASLQNFCVDRKFHTVVLFICTLLLLHIYTYYYYT